MNIQMIHQNQTNEPVLMDGKATMTSLELRDLINVARKEFGEALVENSHFVKRVEDELEGELGRSKTFRASRTGTPMKGYDLTFEQCLLVGMRESKAVRRSVLAQLKKRQSRPALTEKVGIELNIAEKAAQMLRLPDSGKLLMLSSITTNNGLDASFLPSYAVDAPSDSSAGSSEPTMSLTSLLKSHDIGKGAAVYNRLLENAGMIERLTRPKKGGGTQSYWNVTDKGLRYGKNVTNQYSQLETQPHWYIDRFEVLHEEVMSATGGVGHE